MVQLNSTLLDLLLVPELFSILFSTADSTPSMKVGFSVDRHRNCCDIVFNVSQCVFLYSTLAGTFHLQSNRIMSALCQLTTVWFCGLPFKKNLGQVNKKMQLLMTVAWLFKNGRFVQDVPCRASDDSCAISGLKDLNS